MRTGASLQLAGLLCVTLSGCAGGDSKQNFANVNNFDIGRVEDRWRRYIIESRQLPNGNTENKYFYKYPLGQCTFFREFDGATGRLVAWRIEGDEEGCRINP